MWPWKKSRHPREHNVECNRPINQGGHLRKPFVSKWADLKKNMGEISEWISHQSHFFKWPIDKRWAHHFPLFVTKVFLVWQVDSIMIFKLCWYIGCTWFSWHLTHFLWAWGDISLEEIYSSNSPVLSEYIKMCVASLSFQDFPFLCPYVSFYIYIK